MAQLWMVKVIFHTQEKKIKRVFSSPEHPKPEGAALRAIDEAGCYHIRGLVVSIRVSFLIY